MFCHVNIIVKNLIMLKIELQLIFNTILVILIQGSSAESERHFSAFNARNIINYQRNSMLPETVEAVSVVLEGYKNSIIS